MENESLLPKTTDIRKEIQSLLPARKLSPRRLVEDEGDVIRPSTSSTILSYQFQSSPPFFKERIISGDEMCSHAGEPLQAPISSPSSSSQNPVGLLNHGDSSEEVDSSDELQPEASARLGNRGNYNLYKSVTAPALYNIERYVTSQDQEPIFEKSSTHVIRRAFVFLLVYLVCGVVVYISAKDHFCSDETYPVVDALYYSIVTMCTIGYGDITPKTNFAKIFSIFFVLIGFGFIDILLTSMVSYTLDLQENLLLRVAAAKQFRYGKNEASTYLIDINKGRMRIRMKVTIALGIVFICIGIGTLFLRLIEKLNWLDSFYLSVMSVTTVGYGDHAFSTKAGRVFASGWLLFSTLAVARAFMYLAEWRINKRHREIAKFLLAKVMTVSDFLSADTDKDGFVSKSEFVVYKLKVMGRITDLDIAQICTQFKRLDTSNLGKITLNDLTEATSQ